MPPAPTRASDFYIAFGLIKQCRCANDLCTRMATKATMPRTSKGPEAERAPVRFALRDAKHQAPGVTSPCRRGSLLGQRMTQLGSDLSWRNWLPCCNGSVHTAPVIGSDSPHNPLPVIAQPPPAMTIHGR